MTITASLSDKTVTAELGRRLAQVRIDGGLTQQQLAAEAGISIATLVRLEGGGNAQLSSFIRVLRCLKRLDALYALLPETDVRPMDLLLLKRNRRQRAPRKRALPDKEWKWGDEK